MILKFLRNAIGLVVVFISFVTLPRKIKRDEAEQKKVDDAVQNLKLYQLYACPFCVKTRRTIHRLNLPIEYRSVQKGSPYRAELEQQGSKVQVPCLKIADKNGVQWMYESSDIIRYLQEQFA